MDFSNNKPIYKQIIDYCYGKIMAGEWETDGRIPSIKELSVAMAVNTRTVLKAYDDMQDLGVIYQRRGLGYYVSPDASDIILTERRKEFYEVTLPQFMSEIELLGISREELLSHINL